MTKRIALGKGLDALLGPKTSQNTQQETPATGDGQLTELPIQQLQAGRYQPRQMMSDDGLQELAESIRAQGIIQPLTVRALGKNQPYEIVAGERRFRAAQIAGLKQVPVVIRELDDQSTMAIALIENIQREDLNPIDQAKALQRLVDEFDLTHQEMAKILGKSRTTITNLLRLLQLPEKIKKLVENGEIEMGHARALLTLPSKQQLALIDRIISNNLSVRETEGLVRRFLKPQLPNHSIAKGNRKLLDVQSALSSHLGTKVNIKPGTKEKGKLEIYFKNHLQLEAILEQLGLETE